MRKRKRQMCKASWNLPAWYMVVTASVIMWQPLPTGFGPFGHHHINASWVAVQELEKMGLGDEANLVTMEIPVNYDHVKTEVPNIWKHHKPKVCKHFWLKQALGSIEGRMNLTQTWRDNSKVLTVLMPSHWSSISWCVVSTFWLKSVTGTVEKWIQCLAHSHLCMQEIWGSVPKLVPFLFFFFNCYVETAMYITLLAPDFEVVKLLCLSSEFEPTGPQLSHFSSQTPV